jgi:hypothetical protein
LAVSLSLILASWSSPAVHLAERRQQPDHFGHDDSEDEDDDEQVRPIETTQQKHYVGTSQDWMTKTLVTVSLAIADCNVDGGWGVDSGGWDPGPPGGF